MGNAADPRYVLRFFFDYLTGVCFWSGNKETEDKFDYPIEAEMLPLSAATRDSVQELVAAYDSAVDPDDPVDPRWSIEQASQFNKEVDRVLALVEKELGAEFRIKREQGDF